MFRFISILLYAGIIGFVFGLIYNIVRLCQEEKSPSFALDYKLDLEKTTRYILLIAAMLGTVVLIFGHSRMLGDIPFTLKIISYETMNSAGHIFGCILGIFLMVLIGLFLYLSVTQKKSKRLTAFFILALVTITLGTILQFSQPYSLEIYREMISHVIHLSPGFPEAIEVSSMKYILMIHMICVGCVMITFPWSGILDAFAGFISERKK